MPSKKAIPATQILFDRLYRGRPDRVADLRRTRRELALGRQIRELRQKRGLTQAQLARALGTQAPAISRIEDADYDGHSLRILRRVADFFGQNLIVWFEPKRAGAAAPKRRQRHLARA
jgi:transcriptional regulator with XRE-family HTH domain